MSPPTMIEHLWSEEAGNGPAVVMVHGLGGTSTFYEPLAQSLAQDHRTVRFDLAGHGRSLLGSVDPPSVESWASDTLAVMDALDIGSASLIGHSMGTLVVQHVASTHPDRVNRTALIGPVQAQSKTAREATRQRATAVRAAGMGAVADGIVNASLATSTQAYRPEIVGFVRELLLGQDPEGYALGCEALADASGTDPSTIVPPSLLITGDEDPVSPTEVINQLAAGMPDAHIKVLESCGHWAALEHPSRVQELVRAHL